MHAEQLECIAIKRTSRKEKDKEPGRVYNKRALLGKCIARLSNDTLIIFV